MKPGEKVECKIKKEALEKYEKKSFLEEWKLKEEDEVFLAEIEILKNYKIDDLYGDGALYKRQLRKGIDSQKPEKTTKMTFDISIFIDNQEIYTSKLPTENR